MTKYDIVLYPDRKLKKLCSPVAEVTEEIRKIGFRMLETMYDACGIGLAAPQVGISKKIFVMDCAEKTKMDDPYICINPEIVWISENTNIYEEGCLSIPEFYGEIERPSEIKMTCLNEDGTQVEYHFDGLKATCAQHEMDHLNGILFVDYLGPVKRQIISAKMKKIKKHAQNNVLLHKNGFK